MMDILEFILWVCISIFSVIAATAFILMLFGIVSLIFNVGKSHGEKFNE